jgi:hypothetical protein
MKTRNGSTTGGKARNAHAGPSLSEFWESEVRPRLTPELVFTHQAHEFQQAAGKWRGGCPRHDSKSGTSFYLDTETLAWRCPACGVGGGPLQYWHWVRTGEPSPCGKDFVDGVRHFAELVGLDLPERERTPEEEEEARRRESRRAILETVTLCAQEVLRSDRGQEARAYLLGRGYTPEAIEEQELGLCLDVQEIRAALERAGHALEDARAAGVLNPRLQGYILCPWRDERGAMLTLYGTWNGRTPPPGKPKKLALPNPKAGGKEWEATKRSPYLFDRVRQARHKTATLVEGVTDAGVAHAHGDTSVIACVAAELSHEQARTLARCGVSGVVICLDPDAGGAGGAQSCIRSLLAVGVTPYVAPQLPDGQDPDEFIVAHGAAAWRAHVKRAVHAFRYQAEIILKAHKPEGGWTDQTQDAAASEAVRRAAKLPAECEEELSRHFLRVIALEISADPVQLLARVRVARGRAQGTVPGGEPAGQAPGSGPKAAAANAPRYRPSPAFRPFPVEALPPVLCDLVGAAAEAIGCDPALVVCPALAVVAGCVGNARAVVLKRGWVEPAVIWALTVADSGGHKSPAYHAAVQPLTDLQIDLFDQHRERVKDHKKELEDYASLVQELKQQKKSLAGLVKPPAPEEPPVYITSDCTIEALGVLLGDNPHGLLLARDEADAWFQSFTRYKGKGGGTDRAQWLELHKAGTLILHRLTREQRRLSVRRAAVSVTGTIQPAVLARALDLDALQAGLGARFLLTMPPKRRRVWTEKDIPEAVATAYRQLLLDLLGLPLADTAQRKGHYLGLSEAARRRWIAFYDEWGQVQHDAEGEQAAAFAKIEAYGARLMLLHHVVTEIVLKGPRVPQAAGQSLPPITEASARAGIELARWFAAEAVRVYAMLRESQEERETRKLVEWVAARGGRVTVRQLQNSNSRKWPSSDLAEASLQALVPAGLGHWEEQAAPRGGHPARWFVLTLPTSDTSDTRSEGPEPGAGEASDARSDTRPAGANGCGGPFSGTAWAGGSKGEPDEAVGARESEVSDVGSPAGSGGESADAADEGSQTSDDHGDAWEG